jgi:cytochrome c
MVSWVFSLQPDSEKPVLQRGLSGSFPLPPSSASARAITLEATFTDAGEAPASPLTHRTTITLRNRRTEAESCHSRNGTQSLQGGSASGGLFIGDTTHGQWIEFKGIRLDQTSSLTTRTASGGAGGTIEIHADKPDGPLVASIPIPTTGGWESWQEITTPIPAANPPHGKHDLFLVFSNPGKSGLMNLDWLQFNR